MNDWIDYLGMNAGGGLGVVIFLSFKGLLSHGIQKATPWGAFIESSRGLLHMALQQLFPCFYIAFAAVSTPARPYDKNFLWAIARSSCVELA